MALPKPCALRILVLRDPVKEYSTFTRALASWRELVTIWASLPLRNASNGADLNGN
jgi:hypothetical protein